MITICLCDMDRERTVINVSYDAYVHVDFTTYLFQKLVYQVLSLIKIQVIL